MNVGMSADASIGTAENECVVVLCHYFLECVFTCAQVGVVDNKMSWDVYMDEACDINEFMSQTDASCHLEGVMLHVNESCHI